MTKSCFEDEFESVNFRLLRSLFLIKVRIAFKWEIL